MAERRRDAKELARRRVVATELASTHLEGGLRVHGLRQRRERRLHALRGRLAQPAQRGRRRRVALDARQTRLAERDEVVRRLAVVCDRRRAEPARRLDGVGLEAAVALRVRQAQHFCGGGVAGESRALQQLDLALGGGLATRRVEECVARMVGSR